MTEPINNSGVDTVEPLAKAESPVDNVQSPTKADATIDIVEPLRKVDSAVQGLSSSPPKNAKTKASDRRKSSMVAGVGSILELRDSKTPLVISKETQGTGWKINTSPTTVDDKDILKKHLVTPPIRAIELHFELGVVAKVRNSKGLTIKDAMDAIYHKNKKREDDEIDKPYLAGFEWIPSHKEYPDTEEGQKEKEEDWTYLVVHLSSTPGVSHVGGKKKKKGGDKGGD